MNLSKFKEIKDVRDADTVEVLNATEIGNNLNLSESNINNIITGGVRIFEGIVDIVKIRESAEAEVSKIHAMIDKIRVETDNQIKIIDAEYNNWDKRFEKKKELYLEAINKIINNNSISDSIKTAILDSLKIVIND
ncbi:MAG: hypothetical protein RBS16_04375 [Candidatus Cloacimonadales bacterium]|jgi:hypothetical protein|nr:hypothetical protein [Candidatus Cloacimonadales bacterium]